MASTSEEAEWSGAESGLVRGLVEGLVRGLVSGRLAHSITAAELSCDCSTRGFSFPSSSSRCNVASLYIPKSWERGGRSCRKQ